MHGYLAAKDGLRDKIAPFRQSPSSTALRRCLNVLRYFSVAARSGFSNSSHPEKRGLPNQGEPHPTPMAKKGSKKSYTGKQKRQAAHIEKSEKKEGRSFKRAKQIAWATVNKQDGGGKKKKAKSKKSKK